MCQCVLCDCFWWNCCGICCAGFHQSWFCVAYWCCKPEELTAMDPDCCKIGEWTGWGGNCCCYGELCCAPDAVKNYSRIKNGDMLGAGNVVIVQGESPVTTGPLLSNENKNKGSKPK